MIFDGLPSPQPDSIFGLMARFQTDLRPQKIDLGVGVYRDAGGKTPIMAAVKEAERRLLKQQTSKTYLGMAGDPQFCRLISQLVLGEHCDVDRTRAVQSPGGSGALRLLAELIKTSSPSARIWVPDPTWPNHGPLLNSAGVDLQVYPYYDKSLAAVDTTSMFAALNGARPGDVVLLHACCHNPTGADLTDEDWGRLASVLSSNALVPLVDMAYQGFGRGLEDDAKGITIMAAQVAEMMVAVSCSKSFSLYRDRVGAAIVVAASPEAADAAAANLAAAARRMYSTPPDHGAAVVRMVLEDDGLRSSWRGELEDMRQRVIALRKALSQALVQDSEGCNTSGYEALSRHNGMFSRLDLDFEQVEWLRRECAVYLVDDGRMNIAGISAPDVERLARNILKAKQYTR